MEYLGDAGKFGKGMEMSGDMYEMQQQVNNSTVKPKVVDQTMMEV